MVNEGGWIKLSRKLLDWEWIDDANMVSLWVHLLLLANHQDKEYHGVIIKRGQLVTGRHKLSELTGISEQTIRTCLSRLEHSNQINKKSTNKGMVITICKYDTYQVLEEETNQQLTSNQPTTNQQLTTNKNDKKERIYNSSSARARPEMNNNWAEEVARMVFTETKHAMILEYQDVCSYYERFNIQEDARGNNETESEYRRHFADWMRILIKNELKDAANSGNNRTKAERLEESAELLDKYLGMQ